MVLSVPDHSAENELSNSPPSPLSPVLPCRALTLELWVVVVLAMALLSLLMWVGACNLSTLGSSHYKLQAGRSWWQWWLLCFLQGRWEGTSPSWPGQLLAAIELVANSDSIVTLARRLHFRLK